MKRIVVKLANPAFEPDELAQQGAAVAGELAEAEVVRVSGSGRILLVVPDADAAMAVAHLSGLSSVAWAEPDSTDSAQTDAISPGVAQPGIPQPTDGDSESS